MLRLPKPSLRSRMEQMKQELLFRLRLIRCSRALAKTIARIEHTGDVDGQVTHGRGE